MGHRFFWSQRESEDVRRRKEVRRFETHAWEGADFHPRGSWHWIFEAVVWYSIIMVSGAIGMSRSMGVNRALSSGHSPGRHGLQ